MGEADTAAALGVVGASYLRCSTGVCGTACASVMVRNSWKCLAPAILGDTIGWVRSVGAYGRANMASAWVGPNGY